MINYKDLNEKQKEQVNSKDYDVVLNAIKNRWGIDYLVKSKDYRIRSMIAMEGLCEEILRDDEVGLVRAVVLCHASLPETFEKLKNDTHKFVQDAWKTVSKNEQVVII